MALTRQQSQIWQAMNIGAQWVLRDADDPLAPEKEPVQESAAASAADFAPALVQAKPVSGAPTPSQPVMARRGPMATRLRRQQAGAQSSQPVVERAPRAVSQQSIPATAPEQPASSPKLVAAPLARFAMPPKTAAASVSSCAGVQADPQVTADLRTARWEDIKAIADRCRVCPMAAERTNTVVADGAPGCPIVMVGEAPGREEDLSGIPFVGNSGRLLTEILKACGLQRGREVAICNVLKCRPPGNRDPRPEEVAACAAFLDRQLELLEPKLLILMGKHAVSRLLGQTRPISQMRGRLHEVNIGGRMVPAVVTYHPSYLLRNPIAKELGWHDILFAKKTLSQQ